MCGIAGVFRAQGKVDSDAVQKMAEVMKHRGPDDIGVWVDDTSPLGLGHTRLSVLDLSELGHQPMQSNGRRYMMTYNGEIYNFKSIRAELGDRGYGFRGESDTEVLLSSFEEWGIEKTLSKLNGMFAIGLWDRRDKVLTLIRDRLGIKPLYYSWTDAGFAFASELKSLRALPEFDHQVSRDVLSLYLRYGYVPGPYSIYRSTFKLHPGCWVQLSCKELQARQIQPVSYWNMGTVVESGRGSRGANWDAMEAIESLEMLLKDSVKQRMIADVPLGAFLSGGIDSSLVVAFMQAQSDRSVQTFSIGFEEAIYNEAEYARAIAKHLGTEHTNLYVTAKECQQEIPRLPHMYDEPFADPSQIATSVVSQLARKYVTVSLSGDGGDELFCGYKRYYSSTQFWGMFGGCPFSLRRLMAGGVLSMPYYLLLAAVGWTGPTLNKKWGYMPAVQRYRALAEMLRQPSLEASYLLRHSMIHKPEIFLTDCNEPNTTFNDPLKWIAGLYGREHMMQVDTQVYLPDDILVKVDRASMAFGLEVRVPLLDHRVVEFAWTLPLNLKYRQQQSKWILRQVLKRYVPESLYVRPKMGFGVPVGQWIRGPLRDWAEDLLAEDRIRRDGYFRAGQVRRMWKEHLSGRFDWEPQLWIFLMFQAWLDSQHSVNSSTKP